MPITSDRAYFTYLGQAILRGEPIYSHTFMSYPPLGMLLSAAAMGVGSWFDVPSWFAPRFLALPVGMACVALSYLLARRTTGSPWAGLVAGVVLVSFGAFGRSTFSTLEPKHVVVLFTLATCLALQARRWIWAGAASALTASCWQPALLVPVAAFPVVWWAERCSLRRSFVPFGLGLVAGLLPTLLYLGVTSTWWDFWMRSVVVQASWELPGAGSDPTRWLFVIWKQMSRDFWLFVAAGAGLLAFTIDSLRRGARGLAGAWLAPRFGGVPLLTLLWAAFNTLEFGNYPDMYPFLPCVALWCGWLSHGAAEGLARASGVAGRPVARLRAALGALLLAGVSAYGLTGPTPGRWTFLDLPRQQSETRRILDLAGPRKSLVAFSFEEVYVFGELAAPVRFLRLADVFVPFLHLAGWNGCSQLVRETVLRGPDVVVVRHTARSSACERHLRQVLTRRSYAERFETMGAHVYQRVAPRGASGSGNR